MDKIIDVVIPAFNEEKAIVEVLRAIPLNLVRHIVVVNNNSTDNTKTVAIANGAVVVDEKVKGYGSACLRGISFLAGLDQHPDIVVFLDADFSDFPEEMEALVEPILYKDADLVIGSRVMGDKKRTGLTPQQRIGNFIATRLIKWIYKVKYTDLGPFRAIKWDVLKYLAMQDASFGWTTEMQVKVAKYGFNSTEIPVSYRSRIGKSKISGTFKGTILAGYKIISTVIKYSNKK